MTEKFNQDEHQKKIAKLVYPSLTEYRRLLIEAGVSPEDVVETVSTVSTLYGTGLRKAEEFNSFVKSIINNLKEGENMCDKETTLVYEGGSQPRRKEPIPPVDPLFIEVDTSNDGQLAVAVVGLRDQDRKVGLEYDSLYD